MIRFNSWIENITFKMISYEILDKALSDERSFIIAYEFGKQFSEVTIYFDLTVYQSEEIEEFWNEYKTMNDNIVNDYSIAHNDSKDV